MTKLRRVLRCSDRGGRLTEFVDGKEQIVICGDLPEVHHSSPRTFPLECPEYCELWEFDKDVDGS